MFSRVRAWLSDRRPEPEPEGATEDWANTLNGIRMELSGEIPRVVDPAPLDVEPQPQRYTGRARVVTPSRVFTGAAFDAAARRVDDQIDAAVAMLADDSQWTLDALRQRHLMHEAFAEPEPVAVPEPALSESEPAQKPALTEQLALYADAAKVLVEEPPVHPDGPRRERRAADRAKRKRGHRPGSAVRPQQP